MRKSELVSIILVVALIASVITNVYFANQNLTLNNQTAAQARVDMTTTLTQAQVNITAELEHIGTSLVYASNQLSAAGLTGDQTDAILSDLASNSSFIINAATVNLDNTIVAVAPANWSYIIGRNVGEQTYYLNPVGEISPVMTPVVAVQSDLMANIVAAPIFNNQQQFIGTVSVIFNPHVLIGACASDALDGKPYELIGMQLDGLMIYDSDPEQQWRNMFTDPAYANFTELLALGHRVVAAPSGYGTYNFNLIGSTEVAHKECYWTTVAVFGQQ
ncbi:MAG: cache domain-containing protein [Candidatus Bathyarchaeota archaeon]|nr:cache domain-containing protein [Candidatus Bathyarchaeota archaeon]